MQNSVSVQDEVDFFLPLIDDGLALAPGPELQFAKLGNRSQDMLVTIAFAEDGFITASPGSESGSLIL
jgi:hypothetical protein